MTIFEKIAKNDIPSYKIWENENYIAILDINPLVEGHTLVFPKSNLGDYLFGLDEKDYQELMSVCKRLSSAIETGMEVDRVYMIVEGEEVPHVHVHLVPAKPGFTLINSSKQKFSKEKMNNIAEKIRKHA
jgi:histidine triad (HIT) family protein